MNRLIMEILRRLVDELNNHCSSESLMCCDDLMSLYKCVQPKELLKSSLQGFVVLV